MLSKTELAFFSPPKESETSPEVKGYQYQMITYENAADAFWYGGGVKLLEIFIPSHQIIVNSRGYVFSAEKAREDATTEIFLPEAFANKLKDIACLKSKLDELTSAIKEEIRSAPPPAEREEPLTPVMKYELMLAPSAFHAARGSLKTRTTEFFVPSFELIYSFSADKLTVRSATEPRKAEQYAPSCISKKTAEKLSELIKLNHALTEEKKWLESSSEDFKRFMKKTAPHVGPHPSDIAGAGAPGLTPKS